MKYHYEYRLRCVDLRNGGATKGPFKKYKTIVRYVEEVEEKEFKSIKE